MDKPFPLFGKRVCVLHPYRAGELLFGTITGRDSEMGQDWYWVMVPGYRVDYRGVRTAGYVTLPTSYIDDIED